MHIEEKQNELNGTAVSNGMEPIINNENDPEVIAKKNLEQHMPVFEQLGIALGILVLVFGTTYIPGFIKGQSGTKETSAEEKAIEAPVPETSIETIDSFETAAIEARSAFVFDVKEQRALYSKNPDEELPLASVAKLMTALVAYELLGTDATVGVNGSAVAQEGDSGFRVGEQFSIRNLLDLTLINSSNDGAFALAAAAGESIETADGSAVTFVEAMNIRANDLGLTKTSFKNPTGLDISESLPGAEGSARDMVFLMEYLVTHYPETLEGTREVDTRIENASGELHDAENTNRIVTRIPGLLGSKTGYTTLAGGNLVIAFDAGLNHPVIISVLGSSQNGRFADVLKLVDAARAEIGQE